MVISLFVNGVGIISVVMNARQPAAQIQRVDEHRFAVSLDGVVRYVRTREECEGRAALLVRKNGRDAQDGALRRLGR